jgi:hypothetical protein
MSDIRYMQGQFAGMGLLLRSIMSEIRYMQGQLSAVVPLLRGKQPVSGTVPSQHDDDSL